MADTIRSVQAQTVSDWEMIVVDDGSTDGTVAVVEEFHDPRVRCIPIAHTGTPAAARSRGVEEARASRIGFIDADDMWEPRFLERCLATLDHSRATLVHCRWTNRSERGAYDEPPHALPGAMSGLELLRGIVSRHLLSMCAVVAEREALRAAGLFDPDPRLRGTEDFDLWLRMAPTATFVHIEDRLLIVRVRDESISRDVALNVGGTILALHKFMERDPVLARQVRPELRTRLAELNFSLGTHRLLNDSRRRGTAELWEAVRNRPTSARFWLWLALAIAGRGAARAWVAVRARKAPVGRG